MYSHCSRVSPRRRSPDRDLIAEVRRFYRDILQGREVRRDSDGTSQTLWFILGRQCVAVRARDAAAGPMTIEVDDPVSVAETCWDAGYTVRAVDSEDGRTRLFVIDPFGCRIELAQPEGFRNDPFTRDHHHFQVHK